MTFNPQQLAALQAPLDRANVATREQQGKKLSYIEGWHAIAEANRIFGFDGWQRETVALHMTGEPYQTNGKHRVGYLCRVRITVHAGDKIIAREGVGYGSGIGGDLNDAHESAAKEAETDAMKRALMTFGNPFGLALYDKSQSQVADASAAPTVEPAAFYDRWQRMLAQSVTPAALAKLKDDTAAERAAVKAADADMSARIIAAYKARAAELAQPEPNRQTPISAG